MMSVCLQETQEEVESAWMDLLTSEPRAAQLVPPESILLGTLENAMSRYLKDVRRTTFKADKR
jgi:hypothetical protein